MNGWKCFLPSPPPSKKSRIASQMTNHLKKKERIMKWKNTCTHASIYTREHTQQGLVHWDGMVALRQSGVYCENVSFPFSFGWGNCFQSSSAVVHSFRIRCGMVLVRGGLIEIVFTSHTHWTKWMENIPHWITDREWRTIFWNSNFSNERWLLFYSLWGNG